MMSSFSDTSVAVAAEIPESPAQKPMQLGYGTDGGDDNGATAPNAPPAVLPPNLSETAPVYEREGTNLENPNVVMNDEKIDDEPVPMVYQPEPEAVVSDAEVVMNPPTAVVDEDARVVANDDNPNEMVNYQVLPPCETKPHDQNNDNHVLNDDNINEVEAIRRKRGRPRKSPISDASSDVPVSSGPALVTAQVQGSSEKRGRGRPAGSGKKHKAYSPSPFTVSPAIPGSSTGSGFMPYIITVRSGEYVQPKLLSLAQVDEQAVCVLSANGNISNVTLQQPPQSGGTVTYQGCFEILSLSGSYLLSESGGRHSITGGLSVSLAAPKGHIFGGGVAGPLIAGSDVQIVVGTFLASDQHLAIPHCNEVSTAPPNHISPVGESSPSRALLSESLGAGESPLIYSNGGLNNGNLQPVPKVAWM